MLKSISFENFRAFKERATLNIRPITILVGPNSAGKSSILHLLALLGQSYSQGRTGHLLRLDGPFVNMGRQGDMITRGSEVDKSKIGLEFGVLHTLRDIATEEPPLGGMGSLSIDLSCGKRHTEMSLKCDAGVYLHDLSDIDALTTGTGSYSPEFESWLKAALTISQTSHRIHSTAESSDMKNAIREFEDHLRKGLSEIADRYVRVYRSGRELTASRFVSRILASRLHWGTTVLGLDIQPLALEGFDSKRGFGAIRVSPENPFGDILTRHSRENGENQGDPFAPQRVLSDLGEEVGERMRGLVNTPDKEHLLEVMVCFSLPAINRAVVASLKRSNELILDVVKPTLSRSLKNISYIKPLRAEPQQLYTIGEIGQHLFPGLPDKWLDEAKMQTLFDAVAPKLKSLGLGFDITIERAAIRGIPQDLYSVLLTDPSSGESYTLPEVGFGVSQILPLIAVSEGLRDFSEGFPIVIVEQPELHLHPRIQARLAAVFRDGIRNRSENTTGACNTRFVIETHSEHIVRGFQVLVARGELKPDDVAIYYVSKGGDGYSNIREIHIDERGFFREPWPEGFFDQAYLQSIELIAGKN